MKMDEGLDTGAMAMAERVRDRRRHDRGRPARRAGAARRRPDGCARLARWSAARCTLTPQPAGGRHLCGQDRQGRDAHRLDASRGSRCTTTSAACRRFPAPGSRSAACASRCCARPKAKGSGAPGTVLDDQSHHRLRRRRGAPHRSAARRQAADGGGGIPARHAGKGWRASSLGASLYIGAGENGSRRRNYPCVASPSAASSRIVSQVTSSLPPHMAVSRGARVGVMVVVPAFAGAEIADEQIVAAATRRSRNCDNPTYASPN